MKNKKAKSNKEYIHQVIRVLNEAYAADPAAINALINLRIPCNANLADHPTIVVATNTAVPVNSFTISVLGLLNGVLSNLFGLKVAKQVRNSDTPGHEGLMCGFTRYGNPAPDAPAAAPVTFKGLTKAQRTLAQKHGTPAEFSDAVNAAVPEYISRKEALAAVLKYKREWAKAGAQ